MGGEHTIKEAPLANALGLGDANGRLVVGLERDCLGAPARRGSELPRCCPEHICVCEGLGMWCWSSRSISKQLVVTSANQTSERPRRPDGAIRAGVMLAVAGVELGSVAQVAPRNWVGRYCSLQFKSNKTIILVKSYMLLKLVVEVLKCTMVLNAHRSGSAPRESWTN